MTDPPPDSPHLAGHGSTLVAVGSHLGPTHHQAIVAERKSRRDVGSVGGYVVDVAGTIFGRHAEHTVNTPGFSNVKHTYDLRGFH